MTYLSMVLIYGICVLQHLYTSILCILTHTHITLNFIVLAKVICSHIRYLGLQNGNEQNDQVQNSLYHTALN